MAKDNQEAIRSAFDRHFDEVYGYVAYRLAPDRAAAEDLVQDVFLAALAGWDSYRGEGSVLSWLRAIARRKIADYFQARARHKHSAELDALPEPESDDGDDGDARHRARLLAAAMRRLPPESVELIEEKYLEGFSVREMARRHARTEKAIESALSRARASLRNEILRLKEKDVRDEPF